MTNKEAIERLKRGAPFDEIYDETYEEAISLAIKALEKIDKIYPLLDPDIDQEIALDKIREVTYE